MGLLQEARDISYRKMAIAGVAFISLTAAGGFFTGREILSKTEYISYTPQPVPASLEEVGLDLLNCDGQPKSQSYLLYVEEGQINKIYGHNVYVDDNELKIIEATEFDNDNIPPPVAIGNYHYYYLDPELPTHRSAELYLAKEFFTKPASYGINMNLRCIPADPSEVPVLPAVQDAQPTEERDLTPGKVSEVFKKVRDLINR